MGRAEFPLEVILSAVDHVTEPLKKVSGSLATYGAGIQNFGMKASLGISAPIAGFFALATKAGIEEENAMLRFGNATGLAGDELEKMAKSAEGVAAPFSNSEALVSITKLVQSGHELNDVLKMMPDMAHLAMASMEDLGDVSNATGLAMQAWNLQGSESTRIVDLLARSFDVAGIAPTEMAEQLTSVASIASRAGMSLEETAAALTVFKRAGESAPAQALNRVLVALSGAKAGVSEIIQNLGISAGEWLDPVTGKMLSLSNTLDVFKKHGIEVGDVLKMFSVRASRGMLKAFEDGGDSIRKMSDSLTQSGAAAGDADKMWSGLWGQVKRMTNAFTELLEAVAHAGLIEALKSIVEQITPLVKWFRDLSPTTQGWLVKLGLLNVALWPIVAVIGTLVRSLGALSAAYVTSSAAAVTFGNASTAAIAAQGGLGLLGLIGLGSAAAISASSILGERHQGDIPLNGGEWNARNPFPFAGRKVGDVSKTELSVVFANAPRGTVVKSKGDPVKIDIGYRQIAGN